MDTRRMDLSLLLSLDVLLEELNVTRAARRLGLSQSALSTQLGRLRAWFEDPLLLPSETGRGMVPTPRALALQADLRQALLDLRSAVARRQAFEPREARRQFTLALNDNGFAILGLAVAQDILGLAGPGLRVSFVSPREETLIARMERGDIDLYLESTRRIPEGLKHRHLLTDALRFAQRKGHPRGPAAPTLEDYCRQSHVMVSPEADAHSEVDDVLAREGRGRRVAMTVPNYSQVPLVLTRTDCVATLSGLLLRRHTHELDILPLPFSLRPLELSMGWHARAQHDPAHQWLRERVLQAASGLDVEP